MQKNRNNTKNRSSISRRQFLGYTAAGATVMVLPRYVLGGPHFVAPSDTINIAVVGTGGQGLVNIRGLLGQKDVRISTICDVNYESDYSRFYFGGTAGRAPAQRLLEKHYGEDKNYKCSAYIDFRRMFDKEKGIDAVLVATPDHVHAIVTMAAIHRGKHVYCEKPLTHSVYETRMITEAARKAGVATQMGNQGHSGEGLRLTCEWIWDGAIGQIREVYGWTGANGWASGTERPKDTPPVPKGLDWDLWIGPARYRPYNPAYAPYNWRGWWDFGTAAIGDMGCHNLDPAFMALKLGHPTSIEAEVDRRNNETVPNASKIVYEFPARGDMPPVTLTWYDGNYKPPRPKDLEANRRMDGNGIVFLGDKGTIMCPGWAGNPRIIPESKMRAYKRPPKTLKRSRGHHRDWLDACKGGAPASSNFNYSGHLAEVILLGNVAEHVAGKLYWDGKNMTVTNNPEANRYVSSYYRSGWYLNSI